jgi:hypothetical protein
MTEGVIHSENPKEHWEHLNCSGKIILDLGCGFWTEEERQSGDGTTKYFIRQSPKQYIGLDHNGADIRRLSGEFPQGIFYHKPIRAKEDILELIMAHNPQIIKCDIEGMETALFELKEKYSIEQIAIESHHGNDEGCLGWMRRVGLIPWRIDRVSFCSEIKVIYGKC